jgi:hypothetical protein
VQGRRGGKGREGETRQSRNDCHMTISPHPCLATGQQRSHQDLTENDNMPRSVFPRNNMHQYVSSSLCVRAEKRPFSVSNGARADREPITLHILRLDLLLPHSHQPSGEIGHVSGPSDPCQLGKVCVLYDQHLVQNTTSLGMIAAPLAVRRSWRSLCFASRAHERLRRVHE